MSDLDRDPRLEDGWVERELAAEFPELRLVSLAVPARHGRTPPGLRERLAVLSARFHGARAVQLRREPVPAAYRVFFRHAGLDPDRQRTPVEEAAVSRLVRGGFGGRGGIVEDALLLGLVETGVPVWALDDGRRDGPLGLRAARAGERLGDGELAADLGPGRLVVADARGPVAVLFGAIAPGHEPARRSERLRLCAVQVPGVPAIHVEEALWLCAEALEEASPGGR
jgi:DNA/RNA-binding domain of Phe-tRNA-synthetase-like protein